MIVARDVAPEDDAAWARVVAAHGAHARDPSTFLAALRARTAGDPDRLAALHVEDLYLAHACARGDRGAIATLERDVWPAVAATLARVPALARGDRGDVLQQLRERMLVTPPPAIAKYDGRGPLAAWLKVCAVRLARELAARDRRAIALDPARVDDALADVALGVPDPQLAYLRERYGDAFQRAFAAAAAAMPARDRTLLKLHVVDGLGIDAIAGIYHVHRATAARRIHAAREALIAATRDAMATSLRLAPSELDSVMRLIRSVAELTLRHLLDAEG